MTADEVEKAAHGWRLERPKGLPLHRHEHDRVSLPLEITRNGESVVQAAIVLSLGEAEFLHAQLSHVLNQVPAPAGAPECRRSIAGDPRRTSQSGNGW